jgi:hypothetical protein
LAAIDIGSNAARLLISDVIIGTTRAIPNLSKQHLFVHPFVLDLKFLIKVKYLPIKSRRSLKQ